MNSSSETPKIFLLYSTFPTSEEALSVARKLLEDRLIACANIQDSVRSLYRWEGVIQEENEVVMVSKTSQTVLSEAMETIKQLHSYENPCVVVLPLEGGLTNFLQWVEAETTPDKIIK